MGNEGKPKRVLNKRVLYKKVLSAVFTEHWILNQTLINLMKFKLQLFQCNFEIF